MREGPGLRIIIVARHTLLELLLWEMGDQFREDEPAIMHPPLLRSDARPKKTLNSAISNSNRSRPRTPLGLCMASTYRFSQSTLPDTSDILKESVLCSRECMGDVA